MRSHCALYLDVGYLLASAASRVTGTSLRSGVTVDHERLVADLIAEAEARSGLPLLRAHWYDSAQNGVPNYEQKQIALLPKIKLRLGRIGYDGSQKGVDLRIGLDLVAHARNGAVDVAYLVSGDDDLTEAVEEAQAHGVQVVIVAVPDSDGHGAWGVSRHLQRAADQLVLIDSAALDAAIVKYEEPQPIEVVTASDDASGSTPEPNGVPVPSPALFANRPAPVVPPVATTTGTELDPEETARIVTAVADQVVSTWLRSATASERAELLDNRPSVPRELDRALLNDASTRLRVYDLGDRVRHDLRKQFWDALVEQHLG